MDRGYPSTPAFIHMMDKDLKFIVRLKSSDYKKEQNSLTEKDQLVKIKLDTGRSHQIRVQFSSRGYALWGDQKYNSKAKVGEQIALWSYELKFKHPVREELMNFKCDPPIKYPWTLFGDTIHD